MSEEKKLKLEELVKRLNVMDDTFFHKVAEDPKVCEEMLRVFCRTKNW